MSLNHLTKEGYSGFTVSKLITTEDAEVSLKGPNVEIGGTCMPEQLGLEGQVLTVDSNTNCSKWSDLPAAIPETNIPGQVLTSTITEGEPVWSPLDISAVQNITATPNITNITGQTNTEELQFKAQDNEIINLSTIPNRGTAGFFLTSDGNSPPNLYWSPDGAGATGITQTAVPPPTTAINKVALYNSNDGLTVKDSNLQYTGLGWNYSGENINNIQRVQTGAISTVAPATDISIQSDLNMGTNQLLSDTTIGLNSGTSTDIKINSNSKLEITDGQTIIKNDLKTDKIIENTLNAGVSIGSVLKASNIQEYVIGQGTNIGLVKIDDAQLINSTSSNDNLILNAGGVSLNSSGNIDLDGNNLNEINLRLSGNRKINVQELETSINNNLKVDNIIENTPENGVNVDGISIKDERLTNISNTSNDLRLDAGGVSLNSSGNVDITGINGSEINLRLSGNRKINVQELETTINNDLKTDTIIKNLSDNVNIEGSQFRPNGLCTINELTVLDSVDVSNNVISNVGNGLNSSDAVNKQQLDTKLDSTQTAELINRNGTVIMIQDLDLNGNKITNLSNALTAGDAVNKGQADTDYLQIDGGNNMITALNVNNNKVINLAVPTLPTDATNKIYVDDNNTTRFKVDGSLPMTGILKAGNFQIQQVGTPLVDTDATNKLYVDSGNLTRLKVDGSSIMQGVLNMNTNKIISLAEPVLTSDATTKNYVDDYVDNVSTTNLKVDGSLSMQGNLNMNANNIENITTASFGLNAISIIGNNINDVNEMQVDNIVEKTLNAGVNIEDININNSLINSTSPANPLVLGNNTSQIEINETAQEVKLVQCNLNMNNQNINNCSNASIGLSLDLQSTAFINNMIDPITILQGANKRYVDNRDALKIDLTEKGSINGVCPLVNSLIPNQYLPDLAITDVYVVIDNAARDQLLVQRGDVAIVQNDPIEGANNYIWAGPVVSVLPQPNPTTNWKQLVVPQGTVLSVNNYSGIVSINTDDVPETALNPYFTDLRKAELINRNGSVAMLQNLDMGNNKIVNIQDTPTIGTDAANKNYVDTQNTLQVSKSGDSMTGTLDMVNQKITTTYIPVANEDLTNKLYVDNQDALQVSKTGDSMSGVLSMNNNIEMNSNNIVDVNTVDNAAGDLTLQSVSNAVQVVAGTKINLNCNNNVEIPNCSLDLKGNNIINSGNVECDSLSSATATTINVAHDITMAFGKSINNCFILDCAALNNSGGSSIQVNDDLSMGSNGVVAANNRFDANGLSSVSNLDIVANVGASSITLDSNTAVSIPNCNLDMLQRQIVGCSVLNNNVPMTVQSTGNLTLKTVSGGNVNIEPVQGCIINAPNGLAVNNVFQDTAKSAWASMLRFDSSIINIPNNTFPLLPFTGSPPSGGANAFNMTTDATNMLVTSLVGGYYKFDASFECNTSVNSVSVLMLIYLNGLPIFQQYSFVMKDVWSTHSITYIDRVNRPIGTTYGVRCQAINGDLQVRNCSFNLVRLTGNI